ncbi:pilus assembly protein TadG-related protein [Virgibacillus siamensis]|uniref:pilus assembly protein TadG-related protein n=1 Tax=Virgibacillus siamensis TaxID=480071 RepID=UPI000985DE3A|nr:pilus assembly protein TadG-related protein [Virgibacillus siamensis]
MRAFFKKLNKENGNVMVLVAAGMGALLLMTGLVIDGGHLFYQKSHLQKTANAAALSGAQEIVNSETDVTTVVDKILVEHGESTSLKNLDITLGSQLNVVLNKDVPLFFASLFGIEKMPVTVNAKAGINPIGAAVGAVPLGIDESVELNYGQSYTLKVDSGDVDHGNFGVLALDGPGARSYEQTLTYGFDEELKIGETIETESGNMAGPTRRGVDYRIDACPAGDYTDRDCERIMLVIVYEPFEVKNGKLNSVKITGFAYFYLNERMSQNDDEINGVFIKRTGRDSTGDIEAIDSGAYAVSLME